MSRDAAVREYEVSCKGKVLAKLPTRSAAVEYARRFVRREAQVDVTGTAPVWIVRPGWARRALEVHVREVRRVAS